MRRSVAISGFVVALCCAWPTAASAGDLTIVDALPPAELGTAETVVQNGASVYTVTAYTRTRYQCFTRSGKRRGREQSFDSRVAATATGVAGQPTTVVLSPPSTPASVKCRAGDTLRRLRTSYTDIVATSSAGQSTVLVENDFLVGE